jgi:alkylation response protein AidB-like acyl-CoA dehydrogenase
MDFQLSEDQKALQAGLRAFCDGRVPAEALPELEKARGVDRALWSELAEMGVFGLRRPEKDGGLGLGSADGVLVFCELGRRLVPGPIVWSHLAAGLVDGAASGERVVGGVDLAGGEHSAVLVEHLSGLDDLLVVKPEGLFLLGASRVEARRVATPLDPLSPVHELTSPLPPGEQVGGPSDAVRLRLEGGALVAGLQLGIAEATLELAVAYAKQRQQFGQAIGAFQAVKHLLADMFVRQEVARAAAYAAGATLDDPMVGDVQRAVSTAKLAAGEAAQKNARSCIQVHGGMGYTWEVPAHYYLKRAWLLESLFGTGEEHAEIVAVRVERATHASL